MWRALVLAVVITLSSRVDAGTWIDRGIDCFGVIVFDELGNRQDYVTMVDLAQLLLKRPAFFDGKPILAETVASIIKMTWRRHWTGPRMFLPADYAKSADEMLEVAAIHPSFADELLASALENLYLIRELDRAYHVMLTLETEYPRSRAARREIIRRIDLHARHGEFEIAARAAKDFVGTARGNERRTAFHAASDAMRIWLGLGDVNQALQALDWMTRQQDAVENPGPDLLAAAMLIDNHRLAHLEQ